MDSMDPAPPPAAQAVLRDLLATADIQVDGERPWDIRVHDARFFRRVLGGGTLAFGESYMDGWWDCDAIDQMSERAVRSDLDARAPVNLRSLLGYASGLVFNLQTRRGSRVVGRKHYDLGNDFFEKMLDPAMQYSCARFNGTDDLAEAQRLKLDAICRKLGLRDGMRLLDIGCGWGGLARHAARHYGCKVVGVTISKEQQRYAANFCRDLPVEIRLQDYRDITESFDRIVSVGMLEHVGSKNYRSYMKTAHRALVSGGLFLCRSIGYVRSGVPSDPWITRYIFPHSMLPTASQVLRAAEGFFVTEDLQNFGSDYGRTLMAWERNFTATWHQFQEHYGDRFARMWRYYLLGCAGAFRARSLQLFEFVFSKGGVEGTYERYET